MNNQIILILLGLAMASLLLVGLPKAFAVDQPGCNSNGGSCGSMAKLTPDKPKHDKPTTHVSKQCSMDGFCGADEKTTTTTPGGHHSSKHHTSNLGTTSVSFSDPKPKKGTLQQIPSNDTDFTNGDSNTLQLVFVHTSKSFGFWHIKGMVTNLSNDTISFLNVIATIYDGNIKIIDTEQAPATVSGSDNDIDHGISKPFDILFDGTNLGGAKPAFFKLGYEWQ